MVVEESITIKASLDKVWKTFTDLACWADWNTVLRNVSADDASMEKGETFKFCIRPFMFPIYLEPILEEVIPNERVVWSGSIFGIFSRHEFFFEEAAGEVLVKSREAFKGITLDNLAFVFPKWRIKEMTKALLKDLKEAAENSRG